MANIKSLSPIVEKYIMVVSIPHGSPIIIVKNQNISKAEESFVPKRDNENNHGKEVDYDRARALMKWASCCNAKLVEMRNVDDKLMVSFGFSTIEDMSEFREKMLINVFCATME